MTAIPHHVTCASFKGPKNDDPDQGPHMALELHRKTICSKKPWCLKTLKPNIGTRDKIKVAHLILPPRDLGPTVRPG